MGILTSFPPMLFVSCMHTSVHMGDAISITANGFTLFHLLTSGGNVPRNAALYQQRQGRRRLLDVNNAGIKVLKQSALQMCYEEGKPFNAFARPQAYTQCILVLYVNRTFVCCGELYTKMRYLLFQTSNTFH